MAGGKPSRNALASVSFGQSVPTFLSVATRFHMFTNSSVNWAIPKKNMVVYVNALPGLAPRPKYHASHGAIVETHGTPLASHWSATGLVVSGVDEARIMSTLSLKIRLLATSAALVELDWLSLTTIFTPRVEPPTLTPLRSASRTCLST